MKNHALHLVPFLIVVASYAYAAIGSGMTAVDAVAYGLGYGIVWFVVTFAAFSIVSFLFNRRPRFHTGVHYEPRQTRI